jgi:hypothetical protein
MLAYFYYLLFHLIDFIYCFILLILFIVSSYLFSILFYLICFIYFFILFILFIVSSYFVYGFIIMVSCINIIVSIKESSQDANKVIKNM